MNPSSKSVFQIYFVGKESRAFRIKSNNRQRIEQRLNRNRFLSMQCIKYENERIGHCFKRF